MKTMVEIYDSDNIPDGYIAANVPPKMIAAEMMTVPI